MTDKELSKALTLAKKRPDRAWLNDVSSVVLQQALADLNAAYRNFFASLAGKRKGTCVSAPRYRSRRNNRQSIRFTRNARFLITAGGKLRLPKIGDVRVAWSRQLPSAPSSVTVVKDASGRYFASFVVEMVTTPLPTSSSEVGIDLGLIRFAVLSNGNVIDNPRTLRNCERRISRVQRALARKQRGSKNRAKARVRMAKLHAKVADARRDFAHKQSTAIIRENQAVYVEDLCVKGLARTRLAKSVNDAGWSIFIRMLESKAARFGRHFSRINRWYPSTQLCSTCGARNGAKLLSVRSWMCTCGAAHDRDLNAAKNILAAGQAERLNACGERISPTVMAAPPDEAGTRREGRVTLVGISGLRAGEEANTSR